MNIAIDAHSIGTQGGGNETYFRQLLRGLFLDKSDHQYAIFLSDTARVQPTWSDPRFTALPIPKNPVRRVCLSLPRQLRQIRPDVFHCQYVNPPFHQTSTVVTIHDLAHEHHPEFFPPLEALRMKYMVRKTAQGANQIITVSEFCAADIALRCGVPREKITVAHQSAGEEFRPREKQPCQEHLARRYGVVSPFILYVGRIQARKNLSRLVEAFALLKKQGISENLVIVGKREWQSEKVLERIRQLNLHDSVRFPGYVAREDLPLFYNAAEAFVFPSVFEGFGLPVLEAMASGVPTITSFGSSLQEVAHDGALLVDPLDVHALAFGIERVLSSPELRAQLVSNGLRRSREFTLKNFTQTHLRVYESLAN